MTGASNQGRHRGDELTERERQVLAGAADGKSNDEIGGELFLSPHTVKSHMKSLLRKLGARNRTHAVGIGCAAGLLPAHKIEEPRDDA